MINSTITVDKYWCDNSKSYDVTIEFMNNPSNLHVTVLDYITQEETILSYTESTPGAGEFSFDSMTSKITTGDLFEGDGNADPKDKITITTKLDYLQKTDITSNSNYDPEVLETAYDNAVMLTRQNKEDIKRAIALPMSDSGETMELPPKKSLANSYLHFDSDGNPTPLRGLLPRVYDEEFIYVVGDITQHSGNIWIVVQDIPQTSGINDYAPGDNTDYWVQYVGRYDMWDVDLPYPKGAITSYADGVYESTLVRSKGDGNIGHIPLLTPGAIDNYWEIVKTGGAVIVQGEINDTDTVSQFDLVYFDTNGTLSIGDKSELSKSILSGFATTNGNPSETIEVQSKGLLEGFSGLIEGSHYFLGEEGNIALRGEIEHQDYIVSVGVAKSTTIMDVNIGLPEPTRNQDDGNPVGSIKYFSTYKDRSAYGYRPFCFGEDALFSKANFPVLYAEVGDIYEAQHVEAGDPASDTNHFYGVPIPGAYERVGIPDIDYATGDVSGNALINITHHITRNGTPFKLIGNDVPAPLVSGTKYFIIVNSASSISFANTETEAVAGTVITLTDSGSGTFRLTQEGIVLDDAFQGHWHENKDADGWGAFVANVASGSEITVLNEQGSDQNYNARTPKIDGINGTPRTTNETRPKTNISFGYIKVEHVTTAGEPISALRYDTGWVQFQNGDENTTKRITHNLEMHLEDGLIVQLLVKDTGGSIYNLSDGQVDVRDGSAPSGENTGVHLIDYDENNIYMFIMPGGVVVDSRAWILNPAGGTYGYYKLICVKPNLVSTIFDVSSLPKTYDLTSENIVVTLPAITGVLQTKSIYWTNGGTYKLRIKRDDGTYLDYEGEGEGHILVESDGSNWQVREYEDSGSNSNGNWKKEKDGGLKCWDTSSSEIITGGSHGNIYYGDVNMTFPYSFTTLKTAIVSSKESSGITWATYVDSSTNLTTLGCRILGSLSTSKGYLNYTALGTWK